MLGKFIRIKREESGLSQKQFAEQLFVTESAVSKWERGVNYPDITMISDICRVLNISEKELITASDDTAYRQMKKQSAKYERIQKLTFWIRPLHIFLVLLFALFVPYAASCRFRPCSLLRQVFFVHFFSSLRLRIFSVIKSCLPILLHRR